MVRQPSPVDRILSKKVFWWSLWGKGVKKKQNTWEETSFEHMTTLQGTNISHKNGILKMIFLFPRWEMLIPWRV